MKCVTTSGSISAAWFVVCVLSSLIVADDVLVRAETLEEECAVTPGLIYGKIGSTDISSTESHRDFTDAWKFRLAQGADLRLYSFIRNATDTYEKQYAIGATTEQKYSTMYDGMLSRIITEVSQHGFWGYGVDVKSNWEKKLEKLEHQKKAIPGTAVSLSNPSLTSAMKNNPKINNFDVLCIDFEGLIQHDMTFSLTDLDVGETAQYYLYKNGVRIEQGAIAGTVVPVTVKNIQSMPGYDSIEFYVANDDNSEYLLQSIEYCSPRSCEKAAMNIAHQQGDVHVHSFDELLWECQGSGAFQTFLGTKEDGTKFSVQSLLGTNLPPATKPELKEQFTYTKAVSIDSGDTTEPIVVISAVPNATNDGCEFEMFADNVKVTDYQVRYPFKNNPGILLQVRQSTHSSANNLLTVEFSYLKTNTEITMNLASEPASKGGCYISLAICLGADYWNKKGTTTTVTGLLGGKADNNTANDWVKKDGTIQVHDATHGLDSAASYNFCVQNWCLTDESQVNFNFPVQSKSFDDWNLCNDPYNPYFENKVKAIKSCTGDSCPNCKGLCEQFAAKIPEMELNQCYVECAADGTKGITTYITGITELKNTTQPEGKINGTSTYSPGGTKTRAPSGVTGDPHFTTWKGVRYDYHGICDLVLINNHAFKRGLGIDIHIRSKRTLKWSYISTAVVRIGSELFEVAGIKDGDSAWLNMVEVTNKQWENKDVTIAGYPIRLEPNKKTEQREYTINLGNFEEIMIKTWKDMVRINIVNPTDKNFAGSVGLMGRYPDGTLVGRDGKTEFEELDDFGQQWQVTANEPHIFRTKDDGPQHPMKCESPSKEFMRRGLSESTISREDAEMACGTITEDEFDLCVFDVMATGDIGATGVY